MTTTTTERETDAVPGRWPSCAICGALIATCPYAHNTCSQRCACTAAIVEAINGCVCIMPTQRVETPTFVIRLLGDADAVYAVDGHGVVLARCAWDMVPPKPKTDGR